MKRLTRKKLILLLADILLVILAALCLIAFSVNGNKLQSQKTAEYWAGESDSDFVQISCFFVPDETLGLSDIYEFKNKLQTKLTEASIEAPENGSLFCDAWSTEGTATVTGDKGSSEAFVTAVGGDFFSFHPVDIISGSCFSESDLMHDRVLLDRELAWKLFGGTDLAGMTVSVNGKPFIVAGVIDRDSDKASQAAFDAEAGIYMQYDAYNSLTETGISYYEIVLPEPVSGFGKGLVKDNIKLGGGEILQNTGRYLFSTVFSQIKGFGAGSMRTSAVAYPYWENAARYYEDWCALYLFLAIVFFIIPAVSLCVVIVLLAVRGKRIIARKTPAFIEKTVDRVQYRLFSRRSVRESHGKRKE